MVSLGKEARAGQRSGRTTKSFTVVATGCFCMGAILVGCVWCELSQSESGLFCELEASRKVEMELERRIDTPRLRL